MSRLRNWLVMEKSDVREGRIYEAALSMRLDLSQMPKPFQVSALSNKDWNLHSEAVRWSFVPGETGPVSKSAEPLATAAPGGIEIVSAILPASGEVK